MLDTGRISLEHSYWVPHLQKWSGCRRPSWRLIRLEDRLCVPADQLRLTYVRLRMPGGRSQAHMVLTWYAEPTAIPLVLDNVNPRVLPASQRNDLKPVFSFNNNQLWVGPTNSATTSNPSARLSQWRQVLNRAAAEGIYL